MKQKNEMEVEKNANLILKYVNLNSKKNVNCNAKREMLNAKREMKHANI